MQSCVPESLYRQCFESDKAFTNVAQTTRTYPTTQGHHFHHQSSTSHAPCFDYAMSQKETPSPYTDPLAGKAVPAAAASPCLQIATLDKTARK
jgi:hypothetical protein